LLETQFGKLLRAIRDGENRVRFLGYALAPYKVAAFAIGALLAAIAGVLFTLNIGVISPAMFGVVPSIEMVIWVAVGGRDSLAGAIIGTLIINFGKDKVSSAFPELWLYPIGAMFVLAVTALPDGLGGLLRLFVREPRDESRKTQAMPVLVAMGEESDDEPENRDRAGAKK
jgi:urea transport system permease protein